MQVGYLRACGTGEIADRFAPKPSAASAPSASGLLPTRQAGDRPDMQAPRLQSLSGFGRDGAGRDGAGERPVHQKHPNDAEDLRSQSHAADLVGVQAKAGGKRKIGSVDRQHRQTLQEAPQDGRAEEKPPGRGVWWACHDAVLLGFNLEHAGAGRLGSRQYLGVGCYLVLLNCECRLASGQIIDLLGGKSCLRLRLREALRPALRGKRGA